MYCHLSLVKFLWKKHLKSGNRVIDATLGNGKDALFLASLILPSEKGFLWGIDIQEIALQRASALLQSSLSVSVWEKICLIQRSHEDLSWVGQKVDLIVYNLGYLPGSDKTITTQTEVTLKSIQSGLSLLKKGGAMSLMLYPGHKEGKKEQIQILSLAHSLSSKEYRITLHSSLQNPLAPSLLWIDKFH